MTEPVPSYFMSVTDHWTPWFRETLQGATPESCATKLVHEAQELQGHPTSLEEAADVLIVLSSWLVFTGHTMTELASAANRKMVVNAARQWRRQPDGTYQHIAEATS